MTPVSERQIYPGIMQGVMTAPPSKSISHRLLIMAALSGKKSVISNILWSEDIRITLQALQQMGYAISVENEKVLFSGKREIPEQIPIIPLGNSGTSARLLTACASILPGSYRLEGSPRLEKRPMSPLLDALIHLGARIDHHHGGLPVVISGKPLAGGTVQVDASQSSQFLSALLMIAPLTGEGLTLIPRRPVSSRPYVDLTLALMKDAGIIIRSDHRRIHIAGNQSYHLPEIRVEGDYSSASYFAAGAAITGGEIGIRGLNAESVQGDQAILSILRQAGADIRWRNEMVMIKGIDLKEIDQDLNRMPDLVPTVATVALFTKKPSRLRNIAHLRLKESDRLAALVENISRLEGTARIDGNDLVIIPTSLKGTTLPVYSDHRIAMSFSLAGLRIPGIHIQNPECVEKSFPEYWEYFDRLVRRDHDKSNQ